MKTKCSHCGRPIKEKPKKPIVKYLTLTLKGVTPLLVQKWWGNEEIRGCLQPLSYVIPGRKK